MTSEKGYFDVSFRTPAKSPIPPVSEENLKALLASIRISPPIPYLARRNFFHPYLSRFPVHFHSFIDSPSQSINGGPVELCDPHAPPIYFVYSEHWFVLVCLASVVILLVLPTFVRWVFARRKRGGCKACGYDLRASPTRCPECGTPVLSSLMKEIAMK